MITQTREIKVQNNVFEAIKWLETEYPKGLELIYIDYRENYDDNVEELQKVLKGESTPDDNMWGVEARYDTMHEVMGEYLKQTEAEELSQEVRQAMEDWMYEHDTSNPMEDLLKNTSRKLFYIETLDYTEQEGLNEKELERQTKRLIKKYGKNDEQIAEIKHVLINQFYGAPVSFYFYADVEEVYNALWKSEKKYINVIGAYFSTIDRVQGSNWIGDRTVFNLAIPRQDFIANVYLDQAKGNGYGWYDIAGQTQYDEARVRSGDTREKGMLLIKSETTEKQKRELLLSQNWEKTKKCTFGDMNYSRHKNREYINEYPCGNKCLDCGTFWVD